MPTSEDYRHYAEECLRWARAAQNESQQRLFLEMASVWLQEAALAIASKPTRFAPRSNDILHKAC